MIYLLEYKDFIDQWDYNKLSRIDKELNLQKLNKQLYTTVNDRKGVEQVVYQIDGLYIRDFVCSDYWMGGHSYVYSFIPENEIWIDNFMREKDKQMVLRHELTEYNSMKYDNLNYEKAHKVASENEIKQRMKHVSEEI